MQKTTPKDAKHVANQNITLSIFKVFVMRISASGGGLPPVHNTSTLFYSVEGQCKALSEYLYNIFDRYMFTNGNNVIL